ncbi:MAG: hypothetical protein ACRDJ2_01900 [Actinomycetota bacterium]
MTSTTATASVPLRRDEATRLFGQTMGLVALTAGLFAVGAYIGRDASGGWAISWFLVSIAVLLGINAAAQRSEQLAVGLLFGFGLVTHADFLRSSSRHTFRRVPPFHRAGRESAEEEGRIQCAGRLTTRTTPRRRT